MLLPFLSRVSVNWCLSVSSLIYFFLSSPRLRSGISLHTGWMLATPTRENWPVCAYFSAAARHPPEARCSRLQGLPPSFFLLRLDLPPRSGHGVCPCARANHFLREEHFSPRVSLALRALECFRSMAESGGQSSLVVFRFCTHTFRAIPSFPYLSTSDRERSPLSIANQVGWQDESTLFFHLLFLRKEGTPLHRSFRLVLLLRPSVQLEWKWVPRLCPLPCTFSETFRHPSLPRPPGGSFSANWSEPLQFDCGLPKVVPSYQGRFQRRI